MLFRSAANRIQKALAAGDRDVAARLAHSLKGVAANLGITAVARLAKQLEGSISSGASSEQAQLMGDLQSELSQVCDAIGNALPEMTVEPAAAAPGARDQDQWRQRLTGIRRMLEAGDPDVLALLEGASSPEQVELRLLVESFDFDAALKFVDRLLDS